MSIIFTPLNIGNLIIKNRLVNSATHEGMAESNGEVTENIIKRYERLARGDIGLIITGQMFVNSRGKVSTRQIGIHSDEMVPGLKKLTEAVHAAEGKIVFQLSHTGRQANEKIIGQHPAGPSADGKDPMYSITPRQLTETEIKDIIYDFGWAAERAVKAGANGIQIHAAHGYLVNQFLSPFFNRRNDKWGGSSENQFRFLKKIILGIKKILPQNMPLLVKLNSNDYTPLEGVTPFLAAEYARWLSDLDIDGLEISCGTLSYSFATISRGDIPVNEMVSVLTPERERTMRPWLESMQGKYDLQEGYNLKAAKIIKPNLKNTALLLVGGMRSVKHLEEILKNGYADFISMSRPFIREPHLARKIKKGERENAACTSCNKCFAAVRAGLPVRCYYKGFPTSKKKSPN